MPTENRSSNTEMVSVQATIESLEEAYAGDSALEFMNDAAQLLRQFKSISTLEHQGEPVAYIEAADLRDIACGSPWGGTVWGRQSREPYPPRVPVYTHADPGEVDQLSQVIRDLNDERDEIGAEVGRLRAQLADLKRRHDVLHRDMATIAGREVPKGVTVSDYAAAAIADALSGSAGPSSTAWGCRPCKVEMADKRPCDLCGAESSAPVERDERAVTNAFHDWAFYKKGEAIGRMDGQQAALEGFIAGADWQARAAQARKPS